MFNFKRVSMFLQRKHLLSSWSRISASSRRKQFRRTVTRWNKLEEVVNINPNLYNCGRSAAVVNLDKRPLPVTWELHSCNPVLMLFLLSFVSLFFIHLGYLIVKRNKVVGDKTHNLSSSINDLGSSFIL